MYADYSAVSDNDYLSDLNQTLDIGRDTHLLRRGGLRYQDQWQLFEAYLAGYQTITDTVAERNRPYEQLPEILYGANVHLGMFEVGLESQYTWFDRDNDDLTGLDRAVGQRRPVLRAAVAPRPGVAGGARWSGARDAVRLPADPEEGMDVRAFGTVTLYEKRGDFQFIVRAVEGTGAGGLWPLGLIFLCVYSLLALLGAALADVIARRRRGLGGGHAHGAPGPGRDQRLRRTRDQRQRCAGSRR